MDQKLDTILKETDWNKLPPSLDRDEGELTLAMIARWGPEVVEAVASIKSGLERAVSFYDDLAKLADEISSKDYEGEFREARKQIDFWSWGLGGVHDAVAKTRYTGIASRAGDGRDEPLWMDSGRWEDADALE